MIAALRVTRRARRGLGSASYAYRGDGLRASKTVGTTTTTYSWDLAAGLPVVLQDGTYSHVYGAGGQLISQTDAAGTQSYLLADGLGSTRAQTDAAGGLTATYDYDAFGALRATAGTLLSEYRFTGQQDDPALGMQYLRARYYDPATGRFLSRDPLGGSVWAPHSLHRYAYVRNSPTNLSDPTGLCGELPGGLGLAECIVEWAAQRAPAAAGAAAALTVVAWAYVRDRQGQIADFGNSCYDIATEFAARLRPDPDATGPHSTFRRDGTAGRVNHYQEWQPKANPHPRDPNPWESVKRYDDVGPPHTNNATGDDVTTPHVHDPQAPGGIRPAQPGEIPN